MRDLRPVAIPVGLALLATALALPLAAGKERPRRRVVVPGLGLTYVERVPEAKAELLRVINEERRAQGLSALAYDLLGAKVGDEFCEEAARDRTTGHWDLEGRAPYLRWTLAGGIDHHAQNFAAESRTGYGFTEPPAILLKRMHAEFMAERPPDDGHRRTVLDPSWTHVGIGYAVVGGELRMTEEYSRRVLEWAELPEGPVKAGGGAFVVLKLPSGWSVGAVEVAFEAPPAPMSRAEIAARSSYGLPPAWRTLRPYPPAGSRWKSGEPGDFRPVAGGRLELQVPLDRGPGHYYVVLYACQGNVNGRRLYPVAIPLLVAE